MKRSLGVCLLRVLLGAVVLMASVDLWAAPLELKGLRIGMSAADAKMATASYGMRCEDDGVCIATRPVKIGAAKASFLMYRALDEAVCSVFVVFEHDDYSGVRAAVVQKFGEPTATRVREYVNGLGGTLTGESAYWEEDAGPSQGNVRLMLDERGPRGSASSLHLAGRVCLAKSEAAKKKKAAKDAENL